MFNEERHVTPEPATIHEVYRNAASCEEHVLGILPQELIGAETIYAAGGCACFQWAPDMPNCNSYCDEGSFGLAKLADGRYLVIEENSDSTGHGCQCSGGLWLSKTLPVAIISISRELRALLPAELLAYTITWDPTALDKENK